MACLLPLKLFPLTPPQGFLRVEGRSLMEPFHVELCVSLLLILFIMSVFVSISVFFFPLTASGHLSEDIFEHSSVCILIKCKHWVCQELYIFWFWHPHCRVIKCPDFLIALMKQIMIQIKKIFCSSFRGS